MISSASRNISDLVDQREWLFASKSGRSQDSLAFTEPVQYFEVPALNHCQIVNALVSGAMLSWILYRVDRRGGEVSSERMMSPTLGDAEL